MRILVTGASGFIGRRFLEQACDGWDITAVWRSSSDFPEFVSSLRNRHIHPSRIDLTDPDAAKREAGHDFDVLLHLAANGDPARSLLDPQADRHETERTAFVTFNTFHAAKLIYFSTGAVYEGSSGLVCPRTPCNPTLPYAVTHLAAERYAEKAVRDGRFGAAAILRFFGAYGPHEPERKIYSRLCRAFILDKKREFTLRGNGSNLIDAMFVDDTIAAIKAVIQGSTRSGTWDLSSGNAMTLRELVERAAAIFHATPVSINYEGRSTEAHAFRSSPDAFSSEFGFRPTIPLEEGLPILAQWLKDRS